MTVRILLATDAFPPNCGGSGWSTWELARGLRARGHDITVVQPRPASPRGTRSREHDGFEVIEFGSAAPGVPFVRNYFKNERLTAALTPLLARVAGQRQIDIVHGQHVLTGPAAIAAGRAIGRPSVCTVRDYWPVCYWSDLIVDPSGTALCPACSVGGMARCLRPRAGIAWPLALPLVPYMRANLARKQDALAHADAVIAVSSTIAADLRERAPAIPAANIHVIPNPVGFEATRAAAARPAPLEGCYAIYAGKLAPNKGTAWLVDVARDAALPWPLVIVGDGPDRPRLEAASRASGRDIRLLGWLPRDDALVWLAHAAMVVFPSVGPESLSRVLLESGALGRAIAAMDTGGTRDIVTHERTGLLSSTPAALARDVARLAADEALRERLGAAAQRFVETTFEASRVVSRVENLYRELLARKGARRA